jgi:hypothetical protein
MMKDWQEAREQVAEMRKTNKTAAELLNKKITEVIKKNHHVDLTQLALQVMLNLYHKFVFEFSNLLFLS